MRRETSKQVACVWLTVLLVTPPLSACLWDFDTLAVERSRFPDALELITGQFPYHSQPYYQWRIDERQSRLQAEDSPLLYDDIAVAYDKLGQHDKAIETIQQKEVVFPGLYETEANLGTFYIHSGDYQKGLEHIGKAIDINPNAHFGREVYQKLLVEYLLSKQVDGETKLPLGTPNEVTRPDFTIEDRSGFDSFLRTQLSWTDNNEDEEVRKALKGVLGMMRFGNHHSPILLEAVGDLLLAKQSIDAKRLAARAYLVASYQVDDKQTQAAYRKLASAALSANWYGQTIGAYSNKSLPVKDIEDALQRELKDAEAFHEELKSDEIRWIREGANVDENFTQKYLTEKDNFATFVALGAALCLGLFAFQRYRSRPSVKQEVAEPNA